MRSGYMKRVFWHALRAGAGRALIHATDNYEWKEPYPKLRGAIRQANTGLNGSAATPHSPGTPGFNAALTANGKRSIYYT